MQQHPASFGPECRTSGYGTIFLKGKVIQAPVRKRYLHYLGLTLFGLLAIIALLATILPVFPSKEWYIRIFDYPRLQTFIISLLALGWYTYFYHKRGKRGILFVIMFGIVIVVQAYKAWPYTPFGSMQVLDATVAENDASTVSLLICNVLQTNTSYEKVIEKVEHYRPDIFITTESDSTWQRALSPIEKDYPYRVPIPLSNTYGMHLYARLPLQRTSVRYLVEPDIPSVRTAVQLRSGAWITLFIVHPRPPVPGESSDSRERDAEIILVGREARREKGGVIVAGDFNDVAWSETTELFQEVTGYLDPRRGRGFYNTFHARYPIFRWPLDHIFHSRHFRLVTLARTGRVNSDHFPIFVKLSYEPSEKEEQLPVKKEPSTEKKATETIKKGTYDPDAPGE